MSAAAAAESRSQIKIFPKFLGMNGNDAKFFGDLGKSAISPTKKVGFPFLETFVSFF
jgi:hypothetical protein